MTKKFFETNLEFGTKTKKLEKGYILIDSKGRQITPESSYISSLHGSHESPRIFCGETIDNENYFCDPFGNMVSKENAKIINEKIVNLEMHPEMILDLQKQDNKILYLTALCYFNEMLKCEMWEYSYWLKERHPESFVGIGEIAKKLVKEQDKLPGFIGKNIKSLIKEIEKTTKTKEQAM